MAGNKVTLKLLMDPSGKKVLFAEAGKDFVDFIFSLLALPLGTVIRILSTEKMVGCLGNLYKSIENLNYSYMQPNQSKDSVLKPQAHVLGAQLPLLLPKDTPPSKRVVYKCVNYTSANSYHSKCRNYVADDPRCVCPACLSAMGSIAIYVTLPTPAPAPAPAPAPPVSSSSSKTGGDQGGYVKGVVSYMVMDDLVVKPLSTIEILTLLNQYHVKDLESLQHKVELGIEEGMELLRASLQSKTVLTDVFCPKKRRCR